ncbi:hypothetical protein ABIA39_008121 [Nocardia sp. GAS34]
MDRWQAISWMALPAAVLGASELLNRIRFPALSMIAAPVLGPPSR